MFTLRGGGETPPRPHFSKVLREKATVRVRPLVSAFVCRVLRWGLQSRQSVVPTETSTSLPSARDGARRKSRRRGVRGERGPGVQGCECSACRKPRSAAVSVWGPRASPGVRQCSPAAARAPRLLSMPSAGPPSDLEFQIEIPPLRVLAAARGVQAPPQGTARGDGLGRRAVTLGVVWPAVGMDRGVNRHTRRGS